MNSFQTMPKDTPNVALLIDWENIKCSTLENLQTPPDIITLKKIARRYGTLRIGRAYANWTDPSGWHAGDVERLVALGIEPVFVPTRHFTKGREDYYEKDLVDLRLACDGMELLATHPDIGCFVVASGDGALETLLSKLSAGGKRIVRIAVQESLSKGTRVLGEERVAYNDWIKGFRLEDDAGVTEAITAFTAAVRELVENGTACGLDAIKIRIQREQPDFEEENLGIATFRHLAYVAESRGFVRIDASREPAVAYLEEAASKETRILLPTGASWSRFIHCLDPRGDYTKQGLEATCQSIDFGTGVNAGQMIDAAVKSDVLVKFSESFVARDYDSRQAKKTYSTKYRLNTHHPRVQVAFATVPLGKPRDRDT